MHREYNGVKTSMVGAAAVPTKDIPPVMKPAHQKTMYRITFEQS